MAARLTLQVVQGAARDFLLQVQPSATATPWSDTNPSPFLLSDALSATVWAGLDQPSLLTLTPTWVDVAAATYYLPVSNSQTAGLTPSVYFVQIKVTRAGKTAVIANCRLEIQPSPGSAALVPVYGTLQDMLLYCSWIEDVQTESDQAGFLAQRGRARSWVDDALVDRFKFRSMSAQLGDPGTFPLFMGLAVDASPTKFFRDILAANTGVGGSSALIVTPTVREAVSKMALHYVLADHVGRNPESPYATLASNFARSAVSCLKSLRAEIDINGDGLGDYIVNMSTTDLR